MLLPMPHAILTAIGSDRPGLVDEVSRFIFERAGNIEDSRMVNLRGQFAMMVLLSAEPPALTRLRTDLSAFAQSALLHAELKPIDPPQPPLSPSAPAATPALPFRLTATAMDQPGLVHRISHLLRTLHVNIESLDTRLAPAPVTGTPLFELELLMAVPHSTQLSNLRTQLAQLCDELNVDWQLAPV